MCEKRKRNNIFHYLISRRVTKFGVREEESLCSFWCCVFVIIVVVVVVVVGCGRGC